MTTSPLVPAATDKIGAMGSAFYFDPATGARAQELGLDAFKFYVIGRGGVLGDVDSGVVVSAFGYFAPGRLGEQWDKAKAVIEPRTAGREYFECCAAFGRAKFGGVEELDELCDALGKVNDAADPAGLALYAGIRAEPLADDPAGRAMQLVTVLREYRGSAHLAAVITQLLEPRIAHYMRRPEMFAAFGYGEDQAPEVTDEHRTKLAAADELTDRIVDPAYSVLDGAEAETVMRVLGAMEAVLAS
ncbi:MAG: SCO6745 family protein [Acidimicrobiales bacterium]